MFLGSRPRASDPLGDYSGIYGCRAFPPGGPNDVRWCNKTAQAAMDALGGHYEQSERTAAPFRRNERGGNLGGIRSNAPTH